MKNESTVEKFVTDAHHMKSELATVAPSEVHFFYH